MEIEIILWKTVWYCSRELLSLEHHAGNCYSFFLMNYWILSEHLCWFLCELLYWLFWELLYLLWVSELLYWLICELWSSEHHPTNSFFLMNHWIICELLTVQFFYELLYCLFSDCEMQNSIFLWTDFIHSIHHVFKSWFIRYRINYFLLTDLFGTSCWIGYVSCLYQMTFTRFVYSYYPPAKAVRDIVIAAVCPSVTLSCLHNNLSKHG